MNIRDRFLQNLLSREDTVIILEKPARTVDHDVVD